MVSVRVHTRKGYMGMGQGRHGFKATKCPLRNTIGKAAGRGSPGAQPPPYSAPRGTEHRPPPRGGGVTMYVKIGTTTKVHFWGYLSVDLFRKCNRMRDFTGVI